MMEQFKIGDWVQVIAGHERPIGSLFKVKSCLTSYKVADVKLWEPKEGEWCWFWNSALGIWFISTLKDFGEYNNSIQYRCNSVYYICEKCEPFIGELPSFLKDK